MRLSKFSDVLGLIPACRKAGEAEGVLLRLRPQHSQQHNIHTRCSCTGAQESWRVLRSSQIKRRSCVISNAVFGALFKILAPSKNLQRGPRTPAPPCQHATAPSPSYVGQRVHLVHFLLRLLLILNRKILYTQTLRFRCFLRYFT